MEPLFAQSTNSAGSAAGPSFLSMMPMFILMFAIIYFLILRPQQKKQKQTQQMLEGIKKGDKVCTIGGMYGIVMGIHDQIVVLKVGENNKIEFKKSAISTVVPGGEENKDLKKE